MRLSSSYLIQGQSFVELDTDPFQTLFCRAKKVRRCPLDREIKRIFEL